MKCSIVVLLFFCIARLGNAQNRVISFGNTSRTLNNPANPLRQQNRNSYNRDSKDSSPSSLFNSTSHVTRKVTTIKSNERATSDKKTQKELTPVSENQTLVKNEESGKTISLVTVGEGPTKEQATKVALRSAIEQAFGTFVSANTTVVNDELIKDEIVSIASGNIQSYKEISCVDVDENTKSVSIQAVISINKLQQFAKSHGLEAELSGATYAMNVQQQKLNRENEKVALDNLALQIEKLTQYQLFDYALNLGEPAYNESKNYYSAGGEVYLKPNQNLKNIVDLYQSTFQTLSLDEIELKNYEKCGFRSYSTNRVGAWSLKNKIEYHLRSSEEDVLRCLNRIYNAIMIQVIGGVSVSDNLGNESKITELPIEAYEYEFSYAHECDFPQDGYSIDHDNRCLGEVIRLSKGKYRGYQSSGTIKIHNFGKLYGHELRDGNLLYPRFLLNTLIEFSNTDKDMFFFRFGKAYSEEDISKLTGFKIEYNKIQLP